MTRPYNLANPGVDVFEAMERRERELRAIFEPSAIDKVFEQHKAIERLLQPIAFDKMIADQTRLAAWLDDPIQRAIERHLTSPAHIARIEAGFAAAARIPEHWQLDHLTRAQEYLSAIDQLNQGQRLLEQQQAFLARFGNPFADIDRLSVIAADAVTPWQGQAATDWQADLAGRMGAITTDWALVDAPEASAEAFARLGRLADVVCYSEPYSDESAEALLTDLGVPTEAAEEVESVEAREERFDKAGRERNLIAFPPANFIKITTAAGAPANFPGPPPLVAVGGLIEPVGYSPEVAFLLTSLEAHLRQHVSVRLQAEAGHAWLKQRVPEELRRKWRTMAEEAEVLGKPVFEVIHYANFMDLVDIMARRDNWPFFSPAFRDPNNLRVSMSRLYSVRNDLAHARPISQTDVLIVRIEATLLFRSMGFTLS
jgi:hypothetical protein